MGGLFSALRRSERRSMTVVPSQAFRSVSSVSTVSGANVTPDLAMKVSTVYACVTHLADSIAMLPLAPYLESEGGRRRSPAKEHRSYAVIKSRPNRWQTAFEWRRMMAGHMLLRGASYSQITYSAEHGEELVPLHPDRVTPFQGADGDLYFHYQPAIGSPRILLREEVHVWRGFGSDIFSVTSPIRLHAESIGLAMAALEHGARVFSNGAISTGLIRHPKQLSDSAFERLRREFSEKYQGLANHHKPILLEEGMEFEKLSLNADEVQMLETRIHQVSEICSIWRMNPLLIGYSEKTSSWGSGVEQITIGHLTFTLSPHLRMIEQAMERDLLSISDVRKGHFIRYTDNALLRVDLKAKAEYYKAAIGGNNNPGWMRRNEVRALEELDWADGLDEFVMPEAYSAKPKADSQE